MKKWQKKLLMSTALLGAVAPLVEPTTNIEARSQLKTDNKGTYYTLKAGDTLYRIGQRYDISVNDLKNMNNISNSEVSRLQVGRKIYIELKNQSEKPKEEDIDRHKDNITDWIELEAQKATYRDNVTPIGGLDEIYYITKNNVPIYLILELEQNHPDYEYYVNQGMYKEMNGRKRVFLYLQYYKDEYFYYSPVIRYQDNNYRNYYNNQLSKQAKELSARYEMLSQYLPDYYKKGKFEQAVRENSTYRAPGNNPLLNGTGRTAANNTMSRVAESRGPLNWDAQYNSRLGRYQGGQHNFRRYTAKPMHEAPWTWSNLKLTSQSPRHVDAYQRNRTPNGKNTLRWGEYRYLGYYSTGETFWNPHFPADGLREGGNPLANYPFREFPWAKDGNYGKEFHTTTDEYTFQWAMHNNWYGLSPTGTNRDLYNKYYNPDTHWPTAYNEYIKKLTSVQEVYDRSPALRANMRTAANGGVSGDEAVRAITVKYASLNTNPLGLDDMVVISFQKDELAYRSDGTSFRYGITLQLGIDKINPAHSYHDTQIVEQKVYRDGQLLQTFERDINTGKITTKNGPNVENHYGNSAPEVEPGESLEVRTNVRIKDAYRDAAQNAIEFGTNLSRPRTLYLNSNRPNIKANQNNVFIQTITVPDVKDDKTYHLDAWLDREEYMKTFDILSDSTGDTASNTLRIIVDKGNFESENIQLLDRNGNVVDEPIPGHEYKIRYRYRYRSVNGRDARRNSRVQVNYRIGRDMVGSPVHGRDESNVLTAYVRDNSGNPITTFKPKHNQIYTFDTDYHVFETAQFDTNGEIVIGLDRYDLDKDDNSQSKEWSSSYDLAVDNVRVVPRETINTQDQMAEMLVQFDVDYMTPSHIRDLGQNVEFLIDLDGETILVNEHVRSGLNRNISVPIEIPLEGNVDQVLEARVLANPDRKVYEDDVYGSVRNNNLAVGTGRIRNDIVQPHYDSNRRQSWTQYVHENNWTGQEVNYNTFRSRLNRSFLRFTSRDNPRSVSRYNLYENYQIDAVRFRSRLTRQRGLGENGWVNLLEEDGYIKAGYGYELEIDVSYDTNALDQPFINFNQSNGTGRWTRPQLTEPLLQDNVYIEMQDGHIRSARGDGGTEQALRLKEKTTDGGRTTWTFEIDGGEVLGAPTVGRFYIGEDVKDGRYPLTVFTPKIRGVNGKQTDPTNSLEYLLYDSATDLGIVVDGAASDDISDHINR